MKANLRFSERLQATLRSKGYWDAGRGGPEVGRFCVDYGYLPSYLYRWLRGEVPRAEKLLILARQLDVQPDWLVGVEDTPRSARTIAGSSDAPVTGGIMSSSLVKIVQRWWSAILQPQVAYAT